MSSILVHYLAKQYKQGKDHIIMIHDKCCCLKFELNTKDFA